MNTKLRFLSLAILFSFAGNSVVFAVSKKSPWEDRRAKIAEDKTELKGIAVKLKELDVNDQDYDTKKNDLDKRKEELEKHIEKLTISWGEIFTQGGSLNPLNIRDTWGKSIWHKGAVLTAGVSAGTLVTALVVTKTVTGKRAAKKVGRFLGIKVEDEKNEESTDNEVTSEEVVTE